MDRFNILACTWAGLFKAEFFIVKEAMFYSAAR